MKRFLIAISIATTPLQANSLDLITDIFDQIDNLVIADSQGPQINKDELEKTLNDYYETHDLVREEIMDGANHEALKNCKPSNFDSLYSIVDSSDGPWPSLAFKFQSIKRSEGGESIAYTVQASAVFMITYDYYRTEKDHQAERLSTYASNCLIPVGPRVFIERKTDHSFEVLGHE